MGTTINRHKKEFLAYLPTILGYIEANAQGMEREKKKSYFHNFCSQISLSPQWGLDMDMQQSDPSSVAYQTWFSSELITQGQPIDKINLTGRLGHYRDPNEVKVTAENSDGFRVLSSSLNVGKNVLQRTEYRYFSGEENDFLTQSHNSDKKGHLTRSLSVSF